MEDPATTSLNELTVRDLAARMASADPVPGGGSAAAIAGAMGAALVGMVVELTTRRADAEPHATALTSIGMDSGRLRGELLDLAQRDAAAYQAVVRAQQLPRDGDEQRAARRLAIGQAMHAAAEVPLLTARTALEVLEQAAEIAPIGNANAISDAGVAALLAATAVRGGILNVRINLPYLPEGDTLREVAAAESERIGARADELQQTVLAAVEERLQPT